MTLEHRIPWALAKLHAVLDDGRRQGWLPADALGDGGSPTGEPVETSAASPDPMGRLFRLGLTKAQVDLLWLLACVELDPGLSRAASALMTPGMQELNPQVIERCVQLAGDQLSPAELDQLARLGLVEMASDARIALYRRSLRASDRVLDLARGIWTLDREISFARLVVPRASDRDSKVVRDVAAAASQGDAFIVLTGLPGSGRTSAICAAATAQLLIVDGAAIARDPATAGRQLRILAREARLHGARVVVRDLAAVDRELVASELLAAADGPVFATSREPCAWTLARPVVNVAVALPDAAARAALWAAELPSIAPAVADAVGARYTVTPGLIRAAAAAVRARTEDIEVADIRLALRDRLERGLVGIAARVETRQTWKDLVLPDDQLDLIEEFVGRVRCRGKVLDTWGFADKVGRGLGLTALFSGPPGTGKTMVAGLIANELDLDLYQVDISKIVSKYIGETEKQLAAVFDAAESGHAVILFDEADSLFGKRSEVRSSNDRYANLETNYLLQRIEAFTGICVLTTNHESSIDPAFQRRLSIHLRIPVPDEALRVHLWQAMIPERAERAGDLDFAALARTYAMSGGYIKNAVLRAAYSAAATGSPIKHAHLLRAARAEYEAMGKLTFGD